MNKTIITTIVAALGSAGSGAYVYDKEQRDAVHEDIRHDVTVADVELDLQRTELELKLLRVIAERRSLTADELDRLDYLRALREILLAEQRQ